MVSSSSRVKLLGQKMRNYQWSLTDLLPAIFKLFSPYLTPVPLGHEHGIDRTLTLTFFFVWRAFSLLLGLISSQRWCFLSEGREMVIKNGPEHSDRTRVLGEFMMSPTDPSAGKSLLSGSLDRSTGGNKRKRCVTQG